MKKLMTMLAAAAMAFGLYADDGFKSGTAFEADDGGNSYDAGFVAGYWEGTGDGTTTVQEVSHGITLEALRPAHFAGAADAHTLAIKTTLGNPVTHKVNTSGNGEPIPDDGLYFDGLVNLTMFDEEPVLDSYTDAKIAVYAQEIEEEEVVTGTNFVVVAKAVGSDAMARFVCANVPTDLSGWHRLTIKAIGNINTDTENQVPGFVVFIDGQAVNCEDAKIDATGLTLAAQDWNENGNLFVSLVGNDATVKSVAFDGQGSVDELVFTTTAPNFAKDLNIATVAYNGDAAMNVQYSTNGTEWVDAVGNPFKVAALRGQELPASITVRWTGKGIYMDQTGVEVTLTADQEATIDATAYTTAAAAIIEGATTNKFETLAGAAAVAAGKTIVLFNDVTEDVMFTVTGATLDLNGKTVTGVDTEGAAILVDDGGSLTIKSTEANGGVISVGEYAVRAKGEGTTCEILSGNFNGALNGEEKLFVKGGTYTVNPTEFVGTGFIAKPNGDPATSWTVVEAVTATFLVDDQPVDVQTIAKGDTPTNVVVTKTGYTFKGWNPAISAIEANTEYNAQFEANSYAITYTWVDNEGVTVAALDNTLPETFTFGAESITLNAKMVTLTEDYESVAFTPATVTTGVADAFAVTVTLTKSEEKPVTPGEELPIPSGKSADQYADEINGDSTLKAKLLVAPNDATIKTTEAYRNLFQAVAADDKVTFEMIPAEAEKLAAAALADAAAALDADETAVEIAEPIAGLYYGLKQATALDAMEVTDKVLSDGTDLSFEIDVKGKNAGFWQVLIGVKAEDIADPE